MTLSGESHSEGWVRLGPADWDSVLDFMEPITREGTFAGARAKLLSDRIRQQLPQRPRAPFPHLVNPAAAAERALGNLPSTLDPDTAAIIEAIKELAHGLASVARSGHVATR